jgi:hypothetical protein
MGQLDSTAHGLGQQALSSAMGQLYSTDVQPPTSKLHVFTLHITSACPSASCTAPRRRHALL